MVQKTEVPMATKKKAAKRITAPANTRMSVRLPGSLAAELAKLTDLPTGTALVVAARIGITHGGKHLKELLSNVAAVRTGDV